ncbi:hypothetical protein SLE2022_347150 [Rubroshorea leprosula]
MGDQEQKPKASLFPLFPASATTNTTTSTSTSVVPQWLSNTSFTANPSVINNAVSSAISEEGDEEQEEPPREEQPQSQHHSYELLEDEDEESDGEKYEKRKRRKKKRKRSRESERGVSEFGSRKSVPAKDYYFDSHPDPDNLAYGSLYRMDVPRYKVHNPFKNGDLDALDNKVKSSERYWSAKNAALERNKNFKRFRLLAPKSCADILDDFIPLSDGESSSLQPIIEESWEDEVLHKTREFNKLTRENPHDDQAWLAFAEFQDKVASMQPQKGARLQTLEKKISILEKATELNPDNEELLLSLMKAYQKRDSTEVLIRRWEEILMQHSGSHRLWREFLRVVQGEFSRFKVSDIRKMYAHAIQALSAACNRQFRQVQQTDKPLDPAVICLELGLVDIFLGLCRFEWQAGYQELATALFQAEIEFSLFCPSLMLTEQSKQRLFEHFWSSNCPRVGEDGALSWSTWLEKEEENRQRILKEENSDNDDQGGWSGWSEPLSKQKETSINLDVDKIDVTADKLNDEIENEDIKQEDDTEALLKQLGIDIDAEASGEAKDTLTWLKWSKEESSRDSDQWMPVHANSGLVSQKDEVHSEVDEQFSRVILFEDVSEYLFSLSSEDARLSLLYQFIDFYGGKISPWTCTNSSSWTEKILSLEVLPDYISQNLTSSSDDCTKEQYSSISSSLTFLLDRANDISRTEMMKFLRNAILLGLTAFPRNYILEEAALIVEELFVTKMNSSSCSVAPCQSLAKRLLKGDRQDLLLCGVYARREAVYGNMDHARKVFDMALLSKSGLSSDLQSNSSLLYLWYAQSELVKDSGNNMESTSRAVHILSCFGSGATYSPYKCHPSSMQLLRAHQGFKEKMKTVRSQWVRGIVDDQSIALVCSAALFEELTTGWATGIEILDQAFSMVLPERRSQSHQLEFLFNCFVRMLQRHQKQSTLSKVWESVLHGLQIYPFSPKLFNAVLEFGHLYTTPNKLRWLFDDYCHKKPSVIVWIFALLFEMIRGGSQHRIHELFERALANDMMPKSVVLWRWYIAYEIDIAHNPTAARRVFFRAIHACPGSKKLWLDGFHKLNSVMTAKELSDLQEVMRDKELNLRTDIYEILLQDELVSSS